MAERRIPDISYDTLLKTYSAQPGVGTIAKGVGEGLDLAEQLKQKKLEQEAKRKQFLLDLEKYKSSVIQKGTEFGQPAMTASEGGTAGTKPTVPTDMTPEVFKVLHPEEKGATGTRVGQMQLSQVDIPGMGPVTVNVDKVNRKVYDLAGNDITEKATGAQPAYAPTVTVGTSGVFMAPRKPGVTRAAMGVKQGEKATSIAQLMPVEATVLEKTKEDFNTDKAVQVAIAKQGDYEMADSVIGIGNWVGDAAVLSVAAKGLGRDVGNLSTEEQARYRMSPALLEMIKTKASLWSKGVIRPEDREAFKEVVRVMKQKNLDILNAKRLLWAKTATKRVPNLDPDFAASYIYEPATIDQFSGTTKTGGLNIDMSAVDAELARRGK